MAIDRRRWTNLLERLRGDKTDDDDERDDHIVEGGSPGVEIRRTRIRTAHDTTYNTEVWEFSLRTRGDTGLVEKAWVQIFPLWPDELPVDQPLESWVLQPSTEREDEYSLRVYERNPEGEATPRMTSNHLEARRAEYFKFVFYVKTRDERVASRTYGERRWV